MQAISVTNECKKKKKNEIDEIENFVEMLVTHTTAKIPVTSRNLRPSIRVNIEQRHHRLTHTHTNTQIDRREPHRQRGKENDA